MKSQSSNFQMFQIEDLQMIEKIGEGAFSEVYLTKNVNYQNMLYATKKVSTNLLDENTRKYFNNEIYIMRNIKRQAAQIQAMDLPHLQ